MRELSGLYVLGALAPTDIAEFEAHLASCEICRAEISALRPVAAALPGTVPQVDPPALLRGRVLETITGQSTSSHARRSAAAPIAPWLAAAALMAAVASGAYAVQLRNRIGNLEGQLQQATARVAEADRQVADARRTALDAQFQVAVLAAPDLLRIDLGGLPPAPAASARAFWSRSRGMVFTASDLPDLAPGRVYQLWVIPKQGDPISVGLLEPEPGGTLTRVFQTPADIPSPMAIAVSEEPAGGVPKPTGELYLAGKPA
jgi:anti-sigma-K factor RskA